MAAPLQTSRAVVRQLVSKLFGRTTSSNAGPVVFPSATEQQVFVSHNILSASALQHLESATGCRINNPGFFEQALALREQIMDCGGAAVVRLELARILVRLGKPGQAVELLESAARIFGERGMRRELSAAERELVSVRAG